MGEARPGRQQPQGLSPGSETTARAAAQTWHPHGPTLRTWMRVMRFTKPPGCGQHGPAEQTELEERSMHQRDSGGPQHTGTAPQSQGKREEQGLEQGVVHWRAHLHSGEGPR